MFGSKVVLVNKNLGPQKIGQNRVTNSWDIADKDKCCQDKCCLDKCHSVPGTLRLKFDQKWVTKLTAEILWPKSLCGGGGDL